jgi:hypothetical protein
VSGHYQVDNATLECDTRRIAIKREQILKFGVAIDLKSPVPAHAVSQRMGRIEMCTRNPSRRHRLGGGMRPVMGQKLR